MIEPPKIDTRDSRDLVTQLHELLPRYAPDWSHNAEEMQLADAMVHVLARYGEILIERMNCAPQKNFLAFLQTLGVSNLRPRAAQVPLTFYLAAGGVSSAILPQRSQVAAQLPPGEKDPVIFETDRELEVVSSRLTALFAKDGGHDLYSDLSCILPQAPPASGAALTQPMLGKLIFVGDKQIPHRFFVGLSLLPPASPVDRMIFDFTLEQVPAASAVPRQIEWELYLLPPPKKPAINMPEMTPVSMPPEAVLATLKPFVPTQDTTQSLSVSGQVIFQNVATEPPSVSQQQLHFWLVGRLLTPIISSAATGAASTELRPEHLPVVTKIDAELEIQRSNIAIRQAFFNNMKLDLTKDFYPFGERPKFGDTLYLESPELFSSQNMEVKLNIEITNPEDAKETSPIPPVVPQNVKLAWEFWDGTVWAHLGSSPEKVSAVKILGPKGKPAQPEPLRDGTGAFVRSGDVTIRLPKPPAMAALYGATGYWIRVRIVSGNYGQEGHREKELIGSIAVTANFAPPVIHSINASYQFREELSPQSVIAYNDFTYQTLRPSESNAIRPFEPVAAEDINQSLYFGFEPPFSRIRSSSPPAAGSIVRLPGQSMSIYLDVEQASQGISTADPDSHSQSVAWEYWSGLAWAKLTVRDDTEGFHHPGLIRFLVPTDFAPSSRFGCSRYWLRATPLSTVYQPTMRVALLNTTMATGATTIRNELLGISNGTPDQSFRFLHTPILEGQRLEVLEPRMPGRLERQAILRTETAEDIQTALETVDGAVWIPWLEVADFYASCSRDRHYVLDPLTGVVTFGDGATGLVPPRGGKIRAARYLSGGGASGNRPAWNISQLKTAVPSISAVCNWIPAGAGGDAEEDEAMLERGSRGIRHGGRAVTIQDYEDLARLASPQVARARCVPLYDLAVAQVRNQRQPGVVSVIVVPKSNDPQPIPGSQLLTSVLAYLRRSASPSVRISVVPPDFVRIDVTAEIVLSQPDRAADIQSAVKRALASFLHPLYGGPNGSGWGFGRMTHKSDLFQRIGSVRGVEYVRDVRIFALAMREDVEQSNHFLVSPGEFTLQCTLLSTTSAGGGGA